MKEKTIDEDFYIDGSLAIKNETDYSEQIKKVGIYSKYIKRVIDVFLSVIGLILLSPIFCFIAIAIKLDSQGSVFLKHERIGKNGKKFKMYKFRTMVIDAHDLEKYFSQEQMKEFKENYKVKNDPRITKIGKFLRKTSLDELPQIYNILKGDLSIIGPRPIIDEELEKYGPNKAKFLSVTPGLTGYWACNGRSDTTYDERIAMELYYIDNISIKMDMKIFLKTIMSVLDRKGAV
ncbi:MAG TPA: exopolysaccharide biosynthesis protein [Clostridiales bacterium]|nr:exopolysaccharide biosynthesis protein [Clostridiales bacterium]